MVEPNEPGKGYEFINQITGGAIPKEFIPCVDQGIQGAMQAGVLAGYEVVDVKVTLLDGSYHEVDSSEMAFKVCGSMAFKEACQKAGPTLLEPIMKVVVTAPESYMGDVMGDINARRGQIAGTDIRNGAAIVTANVPLASMVRLCDRPAQQNAGPRDLQHGAQPLRRAAEVSSGEDHPRQQLTCATGTMCLIRK